MRTSLRLRSAPTSSGQLRMASSTSGGTADEKKMCALRYGARTCPNPGAADSRLPHAQSTPRAAGCKAGGPKFVPSEYPGMKQATGATQASSHRAGALYALVSESPSHRVGKL